MSDVARLMLSVDSSSVVTATERLNRFNQEGQRSQNTFNNDNRTYQQTNQTLAQLNIQINNVTNSFNRMGGSAGGAGSGAKAANKDFTDVFRSLLNARDGTEGLIGGFLRLGTGAYLVGRALQTTIGIAAGAVRPFIENAAAIETMTASYGALLGSNESGAGMVDYLRNLSTTLPVSMDAMSNGTKTLLGFGFAANEVKNVLPKIAALAMGNSEAFDHLAVVYGQVRAQGKMYMNDLRQFTNAGVPMIEALARVVNAPQSEIGNMIKNGKIGLDQVNAALKELTDEGGRFHSTLTAAADTLNGQLTMAANNFKLIFADAGKAPAGWLKNAVSNVNIVMDTARVRDELWKALPQAGKPLTDKESSNARKALADAEALIKTLNSSGYGADKMSAGLIKALSENLVRLMQDKNANWSWSGANAPTNTDNQLLAAQPDIFWSEEAKKRMKDLVARMKISANTPGNKELGFNYNNELVKGTEEILTWLTSLGPKELSEYDKKGPFIDFPGMDTATVTWIKQFLIANLDEKKPKGPKTFAETLADLMKTFRANETANAVEFETKGDTEQWAKTRDSVLDALLKGLQKAFEDYQISSSDRKTYTGAIRNSALNFLVGDNGTYSNYVDHKPSAPNIEEGHRGPVSIDDMKKALELLQSTTLETMRLKFQLDLARNSSAQAAQIFMDLASSLQSAAESGTISAFEALGKSLTDGSNGAQSMGNAIAQASAQMLASIPPAMLRAGLELVIDPSTRLLGIALIVGSGLLAIGSGVVSGAIAGGSGSSSSVGTPYESASAPAVGTFTASLAYPRASTTFQLVDQTSRSVAITANEDTLPNGTKVIRALVMDAVKSAAAGGALDPVMNQRYRINVAGARLS